MCEGGRILHHLKNGAGDGNNIILITGFQAENTLGRKILEGQSSIKIFDRWYEVRAKITTLNELSAHADQEDLLNYAKNFTALKNLFLVHGEPPQLQTFTTLAQKSLPAVFINAPAFSRTFEI